MKANNELPTIEAITNNMIGDDTYMISDSPSNRANFHGITHVEEGMFDNCDVIRIADAAKYGEEAIVNAFVANMDNDIADFEFLLIDRAENNYYLGW